MVSIKNKWSVDKIYGQYIMVSCHLGSIIIKTASKKIKLAVFYSKLRKKHYFGQYKFKKKSSEKKKKKKKKDGVNKVIFWAEFVMYLLGRPLA